MFDEFLKTLKELIRSVVQSQLDDLKDWLVAQMRIEQAPEVMNSKQAAAYTQYSYDTFMNMVKNGLFSSCRIGDGQPRFRKESLNADLEALETKSKQRLELDAIK